ncbi:MAG: terminase small subunit, partial [bacterium]|nr:terminase small subunit [bacterium]
IEEYLYDYNATKAAIRAGYNPNSAHVSGCRNLQNPEIREILREELHEQRQRPGRMRDSIIQGLAKMADDEKMPPHARISAYKALHQIVLAMEKVQVQKDGQNHDPYETMEQQEQQRYDYLYRQEFAIEEFEKEQEEEEQELEHLAKEQEELDRLTREPEGMEQSEHSGSRAPGSALHVPRSEFETPYPESAKKNNEELDDLKNVGVIHELPG